MCSRGYTFGGSCLLIAVFCVISAAGVAKKPTKISLIEPSKRIVNGDIIGIEQAPYMVQIRNANCGGTLISLQHVLTACHCVDLYEKGLKKLTVVAGVSTRNGTGVERKIAKAFLHPDCHPRSQHADIAVVKLDKPFEEGPKIKALTEFCTKPPAVGEFIKVSGWGGTKSVPNKWQFDEKDFSQDLRQVRLPIISTDDCRQRMQQFNATTDFSQALDKSVICTYTKNSDACAGDSGGPGVYGNKMCMVISGGYGCANDNFPGYYISVSTVLDFIKEKLME